MPVEHRSRTAGPAVALRLQLTQFALLIGVEQRIECHIRLRLCHRHLCSETTNGRRSLGNAGRVIVLQRASKSLVRSPHAVMQSALRSGSVGEDG